MPVSALMQHFVEDELSRCVALVERTMATTLTQLQRSATPGSPVNVSDRQMQQEAIDSLQRGRRQYAQTFVDSLYRLVMADVQGLESPASIGSASALDGLQLMDATRVEADIEISRAAQSIDSAAEWELRELQTFTSTLIGQSHVSAESNPLRPSAYAHALWDATCAVNHTPLQRSLLLRTAAAAMATQLKMAWAAACTRLESQGVEPSIYRTLVLASGMPTASSTAAEGPATAAAPGLEHLLTKMPGSNGGAPRGAPGSGGLAAGFEQALRQIEVLLQSRLTSDPATSTTAAAQATAPLREHSAALLTHTHAVIDRQIVELLSRIFESVLGDAQLSPALRAVMARLQVSALRVALVDHRMLEDHQHPVWRLMNRIAAASQVWPQAGDARTGRLLACCESLAESIAAAPQQTASVYAEALVHLEAHLNEELQAQLAEARPSINTLKVLDRREGLERELSHQLAEQIRTLHTTPRIHHFLTQVWARVMTESVLRFGEDDGRTAGHLKVIDDLLWSLRLPDHPQSRQRLLTLLPDLLKRLRAGMALVALPDAEQQAVLDELMALHTEALRPGARADEREPTPQELQRLRDQALAEPLAEPGKGFADSLIEVFSMDTIPADLMSETEAPDPASTKPVDTMVPGSSGRWFLSGRWRRMQLLWRSESLRFYVFAGETPGRTHSITRQALERLYSEGLVKPLSDTELIPRAVERVAHYLGEVN